MGKPAKSDTQLLGDKAAARAIAAARAEFNAALESRALKAIATHLAEDAVLVPGDEAQLITGRDASSRPGHPFSARCRMSAMCGPRPGSKFAKTAIWLPRRGAGREPGQRTALPFAIQAVISPNGAAWMVSGRLRRKPS